MLSIYKYSLAIDIKEMQQIQLPQKGKILRIDMEGKQPVLSVFVETEAVIETRFFEMFQTGQEIYNSKHKRVYIGSFLLANEIIRIHVFELFI